MKSYTDIEQSKKLAEILPIESADACWTNHLFNAFLSTMRIESTSPQEYKNLLDGFAVRGYLIEPAWSLASLLDVIPQEIFNGEYIINITEGCDKKWVITYDHIDNKSHSFYGLSSGASNLVAACYKMILKLHEFKLL